MRIRLNVKGLAIHHFPHLFSCHYWNIEVLLSEWVCASFMFSFHCAFVHLISLPPCKQPRQVKATFIIVWNLNTKIPYIIELHVHKYSFAFIFIPQHLTCPACLHLQNDFFPFPKSSIFFWIFSWFISTSFSDIQTFCFYMYICIK